MEAIIILGAITVIILQYFIGKEFRRIASMKGHGEARFFWWTFLCGPIGMLMVTALPDQSAVSSAAPVIRDELPEL